MRMHLGRTSVVLTTAVMLSVAAVNFNPAEAAPFGDQATNLQSGALGDFAKTPIDDPLKPPFYKIAPAGGKSTGTSSGSSSSSADSGGNVGDVFKQALGDFTKKVIGLLKLPSK